MMSITSGSIVRQTNRTVTRAGKKNQKERKRIKKSNRTIFRVNKLFDGDVTFFVILSRLKKCGKTLH